MDRTKYIGMDVHQASISIAVRDASGKLVIESLIETKAATILEFLQGLKGTLWVTFEEGTRRSRICVNIPGMGSARAIRREQDAKRRREVHRRERPFSLCAASRFIARPSAILRKIG